MQFFYDQTPVSSIVLSTGAAGGWQHKLIFPSRRRANMLAAFYLYVRQTNQLVFQFICNYFFALSQ